MGGVRGGAGVAGDQDAGAHLVGVVEIHTRRTVLVFLCSRLSWTRGGVDRIGCGKEGLECRSNIVVGA